MAQIEGLGYMLEVLRRRMSSTAHRPQSSSSSGRTSNTEAPAPPQPRASVDALREKVRERIGGLDPREGEHREKAIRIFLESIILWEFGDELAPTHEFSEIITNIRSEMNAHPTLRSHLNSLVDELLGR